MNDLYTHIDSPDDLLAKHLLGEATPEEERLAIEWINRSPEHRRYFEQMRSLWIKSATVQEADTPGEQEAWERFQKILGARHEPASRVIPWKRYLQVAAAVVVMAATGWFLYNRLSPSGSTHTLASGEHVRQLTLPDGTRVTLNGHSSLSYTGDFGKKDRRVQLTGEAFFDVVPRPGRAFIARAGQLTVTVLGTSFNVNQKGAAAEVVVETGKVRVTTGKQSLYLGAHEKAVLSGRGEELEKRPVTGTLYDYYRTGVFRCEGTPLQTLAATLSEAYHTPVLITDSQAAAIPITTTFRYDQPLDSILAIISETLDVTVTKHQDSVLIR